MKKPILLLINCDSNWGSTGRITEQLGILAENNGWESHVVYGRDSNNSSLKSHYFSSRFNVYEHYLEYRLFDNDGLASRINTNRIAAFIEQLKPTLIHLHNIHDHWLNYRILFEHINKLSIPIVWTLHDCWSFTGDCAHFAQYECSQWTKECTRDCPVRQDRFSRLYINNTEEHYRLKKRLFLKTNNITLVCVSKWLEGVVKESFWKNKSIRTIYNGVDIDVFKPLEKENVSLNKYGLAKSKYVIGVATGWSNRKGLNDYYKLAKMLPSNVKIVLVGLNKDTIQEARKYGIVGLSRTDSVEDLVMLYNGASIVMNLSYEETFGMTTIEGLACGTPGIVYNRTASPELITPNTGCIVDPGDISGVSNAISKLLACEKPVSSCRERAVRFFNKEERFKEYIELYNKLSLSYS